jgi:hypothetical protein
MFLDKNWMVETAFALSEPDCSESISSVGPSTSKEEDNDFVLVHQEVGKGKDSHNDESVL